MTARTPQPPGGGDVSQTLAEIERRLRALEQSLATSGPLAPAVGLTSAVTDAPAARPTEDAAPEAPAHEEAPGPTSEPADRPATAPAAGTGDADRLVAEARARLGGLTDQVDELLRYREQLQRTARELEDEYRQVLDRIGAAPEASAPAHGAPEPPPALSVPEPPAADEPAEPSAGAGPPDSALPAPGAAAPPPAVARSPHDDRTFDGLVVVDAGPFDDIVALSWFEQGLARVPSAGDVRVSGAEGNRARIEIRLSAPVALVREMRSTLSAAFTVAEAASGHLRVEVHPASGAADRSPAHEG